MPDGGTVITPASPRFVVTELEGFLQVGGDTRRARHGRPGLSCQVLDRAYCHRVVAAFRTEEIGGKHDNARALVRNRAAKRWAELNGTSPPSIVATLGLGPRCVNGHPRTEKNTYWGSDGWRRCLACRREGWKRDNARRRKR